MVPGTLIADRYRVVRRLGAGAMGAVYEAVDTETDRRRALKVMHAHAIERADLRRRFALEARVAGRVDSPFLVDVLDAGVDRATSTPFLVMELLEGETLARRLARGGRCAPAEALRWLGQAALGLDKMHRLGIVHRDLKPSNLFLERREHEAPRLKILDLGVAKVLDAGAGLESTSAAGTPVYMAPEQFRGGKVTPAADIHALGMIAFTLLVGSPYWQDEAGRGQDPIAFALAASEGPPEAATARAARRGVALPAGMDGWFARATAVDPAVRFASAIAAVRALAGALGEPGEELPLEEEWPAPQASGEGEGEGATEDGDREGREGATRTFEADEDATEDGDHEGEKGAAVPGAPGVVPGAPGVVPGAPGVVPGAPGVVPGAPGVVPGAPGVVPGAPGVVPGAPGVVPGAPGVVPGAPEVVPGAPGVVPGAPGVVPGAPEVVPGAPGAAESTAPPRPGARARRLLGLGGTAAALGAFALAASLAAPRTAPPGAAPPRAAPRSPLDAPDAVLACPVLEAAGVDEPAGWLGAAAAATVCERARILLGGSTARTLVPAELIALPRQPVDRFPLDPYAAPDARARSVEAARRRAAAYVDGEVARDGAAFRVALRLHAPDGAELTRAQGAGRALFEAVREAMTPMVAAGHVPTAAHLDPAVAEFSRAGDPDGALALLDLTLAMVHNAGGVPEECARVEARSGALAEMGPGERHRCAFVLGLPAPAVALPPAEAASPGAFAARARIEQFAHRVDGPALAEEVVRRLEREPSSWGRSTLASTASCLLQPFDPGRAAELSLLSVQIEPKNPTGEFCAPWVQLATVTRGTANAESALRAMQAWAPWDGYAWLLEEAGPGDAGRALAFARRAYALSPLDAYVADVLASRLLAGGARAEARGVALALAAGGYPSQKVESELLLLRVEASEARFGAALARARRAMTPAADDAGWVRVQRLEIAWRALELGLVLGRAGEIADAAVERLLDPEPPPLAGAHHIDVPLRVAALCAHATAAASRRCFARLRALRPRLSGGILPGTDAFTDGAERYARGDHAGAARAWRPLLRDPGPFAAVMADAMVGVFERTGEVEPAARLEEAVAQGEHQLGGASLATVRAARRAARRGKLDEARALARQVIEAWAVADESVPAVGEMRRIARAR
ncbi:protein kinase domain-containing protein [Sorangium sp. So ce131]|uniref:protein kinase domain-containing protein n=1 Tax=Sorangium sp. So ce131 TaxID=3133282 RepID=UPI003F5FB6DD